MLDEPTTMKSTSLADREGEEFALFDVFSPGLLGLEFVLFWRDFCVAALFISILVVQDFAKKGFAYCQLRPDNLWKSAVSK